MLIARHIFLLASLALLGGCATSSPSPIATGSPVGQPGIFEDKTNGIRFSYPKDWATQKDKTAVLKVAAGASSKGTATLALDIPALPAIARFGLPINSVASGYIDDLKKNRIQDAKVDENVDIAVPDAKAKRVKLTGHENGKPSIDVAVVIVHDSKVYIFSCDSDDAGYSTARKALDDAVASLQWIK